MKKLLTFLCCLFVTLISLAQAPTQINYQGVARKANGHPIDNQNIKLRLTIHDLSSGGAIVYRETRAVTTNEFGLFAVAIGSPGATAVVGSVGGVNWALGAKFLQVEIDPDGGSTFINMGTTQLLSVPYALYSNNAGTAGTANPVGPAGGDLTGTYPNPTVARIRGVNVSTTFPTLNQLLAYNGSNWTPTDLSALGGVSGTGTLNFIPKWTPNGVTLGNSQLFDNGTSIGIGTITPNSATKLDIVSNVSQIRIRDNDDNSEVWISAPGAGYTGGIGTGTNHDFPIFTNSIDRLTVKANGFVGIGTTTPLQMLDVNGSTRTLGFVMPTGAGAGKVLSSDAGGVASWSTLASLGGVSGNGTPNFISKWTPNGTTLGNSQVFDNGTTVGIGTTTPNAATKLDIVSNVSQMRLRDDDDNSEVWISAPGAGYTGGIGTIGVHDFPIFTNGADRLTVKANGFVGIGTTTPLQALDVNGSARVLGFIMPTGAGAGKVLISNAAGVGSWSSSVAATSLILPYKDSASSTTANIFEIIQTSLSSTTSAITGVSRSNASTANAVHGDMSPINGSPNSSGVRGENQSTNAYGIGIWGSQNGSGWGVYGSATDGAGPFGWGAGVYSDIFGNGGAAVYGNNWGANGFAGRFRNGGGSSGTGVRGEGNDGIGVHGSSSINYGVFGESNSNFGVYGTSQTGVAGRFFTTGFNNTVRGAVQAFNSSTQQFARAIYAQGSGYSGFFWTARHVTEIQSDSTVGLGLISRYNNGIQSASETGSAVYGYVFNNTGSGNAAVVGISDNNNSYGLYGSTPLGGIGRALFTSGQVQMMNGFVGVGTANPTAQVQIDMNSSVGTPQIKLNELSDDFSRLTFRNTNANNSSNNFWDVAGYNNDVRANERLNFYNSSTGNLMSITGNGNVGISTTNPVSKLHIENSGVGISGLFVNQDNELTRPAAKILSEGPIGFDVSSSLGNTSFYAQRGDFTVGTIWYQPGDNAVLGINPNDGNGVQGISKEGAGIAGSSTTGTAVYGLLGGASGYAVRATALQTTAYALFTSGKVQISGQGAGVNKVLTSDAVGNATWENLNTVGLVSGSGTVNFLPKWTPTGSNIGVSQFFDNGVNVGLGTTTPFYKLHINSNVAIAYLSDQDNGTDAALIAAGTGYTGGVGTGTATDFPIFTSNTDRITVKSTGEVGVGTTIPQSKFNTLSSNNTGVRSDVNYSTPAGFFAQRNGNLFVSTNTNFGLQSRNNVNVNSNSPILGSAGVLGFDSTDLVVATGIAGYEEGGTSGSNGVWGFSGKNASPTVTYYFPGFSGGTFWGGDAGINAGVADFANADMFGDQGVKKAVNAFVSYANPLGTNYGVYVGQVIGGGTNYAGYFNGDVHVQGNLTASGSKPFKIDHPLDPANKYLYHFAMESPEVQNVYDGNIITDATGKAIVQLPDYFSSINKDFKYQLTIVDETQFAMARVSKKINGNSFEVMTDKPNIEVSWQVTAVRNDKSVQKYAVSAETMKPANERGKYLDPELYNQPVEKGVFYSQPVPVTKQNNSSASLIRNNNFSEKKELPAMPTKEMMDKQADVNVNPVPDQKVDNNVQKTAVTQQPDQPGGKIEYKMLNAGDAPKIEKNNSTDPSAKQSPSNSKYDIKNVESKQVVPKPELKKSVDNTTVKPELPKKQVPEENKSKVKDKPGQN